MSDKNILHMLTPLKHNSPFDVNMAVDAGYDAVHSYTQVTLDEVTALVQDAMFSRPPKVGVRTGVFFGGKNAFMALDMMGAAKKALVPPFGVSFFADPAGSFTTAAALVACVEKVLREQRQRDLKGLRIAVFGATGVVGTASAVIVALEGADVSLVGHDGVARVQGIAQEIKKRFGVDVRAEDGSDEAKKTATVAATEAIFCAGRAGVQIVSASQMNTARDLVIAADVNAVPPAGIEGLDVMAQGQQLTQHGALGIGPLAIGTIKSRTEIGLFKAMIAATKPVRFDFRDAFKLAREFNV